MMGKVSIHVFMLLICHPLAQGTMFLFGLIGGWFNNRNYILSNQAIFYISYFLLWISVVRFCHDHVQTLSRLPPPSFRLNANQFVARPVPGSRKLGEKIEVHRISKVTDL